MAGRQMAAIAVVLFWAVAAWGIAGPGHRLVYVFFAALPFQSFAVLPPAMTGGSSLTPGPVVAMLVVARCLLARRGVDNLLTAALRPERMLLLVLFWVVAVVVTLFMPHVLAGRVVVVPFRGEWLARIPLQPSAQNVSQLLYLTTSVFAAVAFAALLGAPAMRQHTLRALCLGAAVAVATGLVDFASSFLPVAPLLAPFRTASYALLVSHEVLGAKRVVGLTPEASTFGLLCLGLLATLYFLRHAIEGERLRRRVVPGLLGGLAICIWLSTSSAAYVGLILFGLVAAVEWGWRAARGRRGVAAELSVVAAALAGVLVILLVAPQAVDRGVAIFDTWVLQKTGSSSFQERQTWTVTSWQALVESRGIGVGVGSTRASSSVVGVTSSTGFLGALLYYGFVLQTLLRRAAPGDEEARRLLAGVRWAFLPPFADSLLIGISADFGLLLAFLYGLAAAVAAPQGGLAASSAR
jgi:hypothetical protein